MTQLLPMLGKYYFISAYYSFHKMAIEHKDGNTLWFYESYDKGL